MARKIKSAKNKNYALYYLVRHAAFVAKLLGIFPVTVDKWELNSKCCMTFRFQKLGLVFSMLQQLILIYMIYIDHKYFWIALSSHSAALLQVMCVVSLAIFRAFMLQLFSIIYRTKETIRCLNKISKLLPHIEEQNIESRSSKILIMAYILALPTTFGLFARVLSGSDFSSVLPFVISNFQENGIVFLMIVFFEIVELSLKSINAALKLLNEQCVDILPKLEKLMVHHSQICDFFENLSQCFGPDIVLLCWYNLLKIVLLTYYSYYLLATGGKRLIEHVITGSDVPYRFFVIWYLGCKCDCITFQTVESRRLLAELATDRHDMLDEVVKETISVFLLQLRSRKIQFSVCGLFILDRAKLYGMLQMSVTYIVVMVQFHSFIDIFET